MTDVVAKNLQETVDLRTFVDGSKRTVAVLESAAVGRGEYLSGWRWSERAGPQTGRLGLFEAAYAIWHTGNFD